MKICLVNYCNYPPPQSEHYRQMQERQARQALEHGVTTVIAHNFDSIRNTAFYLTHRELLDQKRGAGFWAWKPYIIQMTMLETELRYDVYIYLDSDIQIVGDVHPFAQRALTQDVVAIRTTYQQARYCKRECSRAFGVDGDEYLNWYQLQAGTVAYRGNCHALAFLTDWLSACLNHHFISDESSVFPNYPVFLDHRHDQALFTLVYHQYGFKIHPPKTQEFTDLWPLPSWCQTEVEGEFSQ